MTDPSGAENDTEGPFPIDPHDLLRHAEDIESPPGRTGTDYRRAVSAAYYALYHALTLRAATLTEPSARYDAVRRFRHWRLRDAARTVIDGGGDALSERIARALLFLQAERVHADYNHREQFTRRRARRAIAIAARAVEALEGGGGETLVRPLAAMP